jgi:ribose transport system ATP-binding protein
MLIERETAAAEPIEGAVAVRVAGAAQRYEATIALAGVDFEARTGEVHGILGENGAGKSTLIKVLAGAVSPDAGTLDVFGERRRFRRPADALRAGITTVFQELSLVPDLTVAENLAFAKRGASRVLRSRRRLERHARAALLRIGVDDIAPNALVSELSLEQRQRLEIAKALAQAPRVLILDEATSALSATEVNWLIALTRRLANEGLAVLFISHRLSEIRAACDRVTILRNGETVASYALTTVSDDKLITDMIGRRIERLFPTRREATPGEVALELVDFGSSGSLGGATLSLRRGEILGLGGLQGQGQTGLLLAIYGAVRSKGSLRVSGREARHASPAHALALGVALVPEDRGGEGLLLDKSIRENIALGVLKRLARAGVVPPRAERELAETAVSSLHISCSSTTQLAGTLSGGNQQKVLLAKVLATEARVLLLLDPTRGVDIGTKAELYEAFSDLASRGYALILYSSDAEELIHVCDRVAVMSAGSIVGTVPTEGLTEPDLLRLAVGGRSQ